MPQFLPRAVKANRLDAARQAKGLRVLPRVISISSNAQAPVTENANLLSPTTEHDLVLMYRRLATYHCVTCVAECHQVLLGIVSGLASMLFMADLKVCTPAACLASPASRHRIRLPRLGPGVCLSTGDLLEVLYAVLLIGLDLIHRRFGAARQPVTRPVG